ncbi:venom protease-like [Prorops nasuta]|uniref:venom protease-like n=1 Tax=Prorops nasuta TaxID=863751 RepID=UPI0034CED1A1
MLYTPASLFTLLFAAFSILLAPSAVSAQYEGSSCTVGGARGVCTMVDNCQSVYQELLSGVSPKKICSFSGFDPIVCCPLTASTTKRTTTTTSTTTSTTPAPQSGGSLINNGGRGAVARRKCADYAKSVYSLVTPPTLSGNRKPVNVSLCAIKFRKLIVGGKKADPKEFPHMTAIGYDKRSGDIVWGLCGGSLIAENFVMTAAHCLSSQTWGNAAWVRVGDLNLASSDDDAKPQERRVIERIRHPRYNPRNSEYHDIALLKLERPVNFNAYVRPACLPYSFPDVNIESDNAVATGWGRVDWTDEEGSNDLLKVTLNLVDQPRCNETFLGGTTDDKVPIGVVSDWQICAGGMGKDTCQGDSGGPLSVFNDDHNCMYNVIGVTSIGKICGSFIPGIYTRIYHYIPWIESQVWPQE